MAWGTLGFLHGPTAVDIYLLLAGLTTVLPLIWFNFAAQRLTLTTIGFIQYLAPSMTFCLAVFLWGEPFTPGHAVAFSCIWTALVLVSLLSISVLPAAAGQLRATVRLQRGNYLGMRMA